MSQERSQEAALVSPIDISYKGFIALSKYTFSSGTVHPPPPSAHWKHAGTVFDLTGDAQWKQKSRAMPGPGDTPYSAPYTVLIFRIPSLPLHRLYFSPSKPAALPSCDHLHDVYLSPLSSALLSSQGGHVYGQRPANPPAPFAGPGSLYHQPLASHGLPLPAMCGLLLNSALTAGG